MPPPTRMYLKCGALMGAFSDRPSSNRPSGGGGAARRNHSKVGEPRPYPLYETGGWGVCGIAFCREKQGCNLRASRAEERAEARGVAGYSDGAVEFIGRCEVGVFWPVPE